MKELFQEECPQVATTCLDGPRPSPSTPSACTSRHLLPPGERPGHATHPARRVAALGTVHGDRALDGESGAVDVGGEAGGHTAVGRLISIQRVDRNGLVVQQAFCGRWMGKTPAHRCPASETGASS